MKRSTLILGSMGFFLTTFFFLHVSHAGGCFSTTRDGSTLAATCARWDQTKDIVWNFDAGPLKGPPTEEGGGGSGGSSGCQLAKSLDVSNAEGVAMIERSFQRWMDVPKSKLNIVKGGPLLNGEDVNFSNIEKVWAGPFQVTDPSTGQQAQGEVDIAGCYDSDPNTACLNPVVFDHSGLLTDAIQGQCSHCSILGFAAILPKTADDPPQDTILSPVVASAQAVVSGACLEPRAIDPVCGDCCAPDIKVENVEGTMTHELGHYLGLDHVGVNLDAFIDCTDSTGCDAATLERLPTMDSFFVPNQDYNTLHEDDKKIFATLYPDEPNFSSTTCTVKGFTRRNAPYERSNPPAGPLDIDAQRCLEVVARRTDDPFNIAVATVSGSYVKRFTQGVKGSPGTDGKNVENCNEANNNGTQLNFDECAAYEIHGLEPGEYMLTVHDFTDDTSNENLGFILEPCTPPLSLSGILANPISTSTPNTSTNGEGGGATFTCVAGGTVNLNPRAN